MQNKIDASVAIAAKKPKIIAKPFYKKNLFKRAFRLGLALAPFVGPNIRYERKILAHFFPIKIK